MSSYYDHMNRVQVSRTQRLRDLKGPREGDTLDPAGIPPMSDPTVTATRAALDANALGMTVEEVALPAD